MTSEPMAPGAQAIILERRVARDDNGRSHEDNYFRIKVLTEDGRNYADVQIPIVGFTDIRNIRARTIRPDGSAVNFEGNVYDKYVEKGRGWRVLVKAFTLPDVQVGSILEYSYTIDLKGFAYDSQWILNSDLFTKTADFSLRPLQQSYFPMSLRRTSKDVPVGAEPTEDSDHVIRMRVYNMPAFQEEDFMPPENELKSRVDFVYMWGQPSSDPDKFWKEVGKQRYDDLENFLRKHKAIDEAEKKIVSPSDSPEEKLRKLYAGVQKLRNISYEREKTEQEQKRAKEKAAGNVDDVWKHGYGNAVELTWVFLALARAAGFEAYGCWVADRSEYFFNRKLMESGALRNNIVLIKVGEKDIYADPGILYAPFGLLAWNETATSGIRLDAQDGTWIQTPLPDSSTSQVVRSGRFRLSENGELQGTVSISYTGLEAMHRRLRLRDADERERKEFLEEQVKSDIPANAEVQLKSKPDWSSSEASLVGEFAVTIPNWATNAQKHILVPIGIFTAHERHIFEPSERIRPVYFSFPYGEVDDLRIEFPNGWHADLPNPRRIKGDRLFYSTAVGTNPGSVHISRTLTVDILTLEQKYYSGLRSFFESVRTSDDGQIVVQSSATDTSN